MTCVLYQQSVNGYLGKQGGRHFLYSTLAHRRPTFTADMTTYYCPNMEEALRRAKKAGREPGCYFGGITLKSGRRGFAVYRDGKVIEQYTFIVR